jgi:chemotaxis protein MotB
VAPTEKDASTTDEPPNPLGRIINRLRATMSEWIRADLVKVRRNHLQIEVEINNNILFSSGSAILNEQAKAPLQAIATVLQDLPNRIHVEGFTDNKPISTPIYPSNWELSAARAASVVHLLMQAEVRPERMMAIGYGEYQPIDDNATETGRMRNRRVVLVILGDTDSRRQLAGDVSPTALDTALTRGPDGDAGGQTNTASARLSR